VCWKNSRREKTEPPPGKRAAVLTVDKPKNGKGKDNRAAGEREELLSSLIQAEKDVCRAGNWHLFRVSQWTMFFQGTILPYRPDRLCREPGAEGGIPALHHSRVE